MSSKFWDERYRDHENLYTSAPNEFLRATLDSRGDLRGRRALVPGDGDGRNGRYLARLGMKVEAYDASTVGVAKANDKAKAEGLDYHAEVRDLATWSPAPGSTDLIAIIFMHVPSALRSRLLDVSGLAVGGEIIAEVFAKSQLGRSSGGPKDADLLFALEDFQALQSRFDSFELRETEVELREGPFHSGPARVIRLHARGYRANP